MHALASEVQREAAGRRIVFPDGRTRLHIIGDNARIDDSDANRVGRARERVIRLLFVADMGVIGDVAGRAGEDERRSRQQGFVHVGNGGEILPADADQFGGAAGLQRRVRRHHRDDVAHMVRFVRRHHRIRLERRVRPVRVADRGEAGQVA